MTGPVLLEICVDTADGLDIAATCGADRIELCASLGIGGLTPSLGMMRLAAAIKCPTRVMIRPRQGDFTYSPAELAMMRHDIDAVADIGLEEPGVNKLIHAAYKLLNLQTYFTAGVKEVRAWTITKGMTAPQSAGVIHTDFEKGFIKAEVIAYDDFIAFKSEAACRDNGKLRIEGKEYVVADGDVMHFRFNV